MVMMFVGGGGVVSVLDRIIALFLQGETYGVGVFCVPARTLIGVILLKHLTSCSRLLMSYTHQRGEKGMMFVLPKPSSEL